MKKFLTVIIPTYNEEKRLPKTLKNVIQYLTAKNFSSEIIIADDGSKDNTIQVARKILKESRISHQILNLKHKGKGWAVKNGFKKAKGEYILFMDADNSIPIEQFEKFEKYLSPNTLIIASRYINKKLREKKPPKYRRAIRKVGRVFIKSFLIKGVKDTQCGFKCYPAKAAKLIANNQQIDGWSFDIEHLIIATNHGFTIKEVATKWKDNKNSKVKLKTDAIKTIKEYAKIRKIHKHKTRVKK